MASWLRQSQTREANSFPTPVSRTARRERSAVEGSRCVTERRRHARIDRSARVNAKGSPRLSGSSVEARFPRSHYGSS